MNCELLLLLFAVYPPCLRLRLGGGQAVHRLLFTCPSLIWVDHKPEAMEGTKVSLKPVRIFSEEFRKERVKEYEKGEFTVKELSRLFSIKEGVIYRWIYKYSAYNKRGIKVVEMSESSSKKVKDLQKRIRELEQIVGQKQLNIDFLEKMIEIAKEQYGLDIKKKSGTQPLSGLDQVGKKDGV